MSCSRLQRPRVTGGIVSGPASTRWSGVDREQDSLWRGGLVPAGPGRKAWPAALGGLVRGVGVRREQPSHKPSHSVSCSGTCFLSGTDRRTLVAPPV